MEGGSAAVAKDERTYREKFNDYMVNDGPKIVWIVLWVLGNLVCIGERYWFFMNKRPVLFGALGHGLPIARACAQCIKLNSALILVSVLRNFLSWLRGTILGSYLPIDKNIIFHRHMAWAIMFFSAGHTIAHYFNFNTIAKADLKTVQALGLKAVPSQWQLGFTTIPGITGHIIVIVMVLMYSSAIKYVRSPMFNVFWYTHHLFIIYFVAAALHGVGKLLGDPPSFWYWTIAPGAFYAIERTIRVLRGNQETILQLAIAHPSKVLELQLKKSTFKYKPGQYLFLNCPYIAKQEWHPFTISSAPEEDFISVHIRIVGDWTNELWTLLNTEKRLGVVQENLLSAPDGTPIFKIDGPFGAASEDVFNFSTVILAAGGIGVTPFASILKSIHFKLQMHGSSVLEKVYFFWISRDKHAFEWFNDVLAGLEQDNINNFLEIHTYLTGQLSVDEIRNVMYGADTSSADQITGLQSPTHFGRPNWDDIFKDKAQRHLGKTVGVFFCGPAVLSKSLYKYCRKYTSSSTKTKFVYHKENF